jgi:hypothetical protein
MSADSEHTVPMATCKPCLEDQVQLAGALDSFRPPRPNHACVENEPTAEYPYDTLKSIRITQTRYVRRRALAGRWTRLSAFLLVGAAFSVMVATFVADEDPEPFDVDDLDLL